jgi:two-component system phosphate regulon response regulator PhoB
MAIKVLIVEDDEPIAMLLTYNLEAEGYAVAHVASGADAMPIIEQFRPDLVILDWSLPDVPGIEICRQVRARLDTKGLPVIMLTARGGEDDRIRGLETGADDYVVKPFSVAELIARVKALLRRAKPELSSDILEGSGIRMDREACRVTRSGRDIQLAPTEYRLLEMLLANKGRLLSRSQLIDRVWGHDEEIDERTVDVHIGRLRRAIICGTESDPIRTVRGEGYVFDDET